MHTIFDTLQKNIYLVVSIALVCVVNVWPATWSLLYPKYYDSSQAYAIFLDIGQGDAALLISAKSIVLIDTGVDITTLYKLDKYIPFDRRVIDLLIITHPHMDHIGAYYEILRSYKINKILFNPVCNDNELWGMVQHFYENGSSGEKTQNSKNFLHVKYNVGEFEIESFAKQGEPQTDSCNKSLDGNFNNDSIVTLVKYNENKILLMGDLEISYERELLQMDKEHDWGLFGDVDILKAGHHCSKTSSSEVLLSQVKPEIAICSVGKDNKYGHPSQSVLDLLDRLSIKYFITYKDGDIVIPLR